MAPKIKGYSMSDGNTYCGKEETSLSHDLRFGSAITLMEVAIIKTPNESTTGVDIEEYLAYYYLSRNYAARQSNTKLKNCKLYSGNTIAVWSLDDAIKKIEAEEAAKQPVPS